MQPRPSSRQVYTLRVPLTGAFLSRVVVVCDPRAGVPMCAVQHHFISFF